MIFAIQLKTENFTFEAIRCFHVAKYILKKAAHLWATL